MAESAKKILIVDDEPDVTDLVAYNLKAKGFVVETLNNPNAAVGFAHAFKPDLAILDVMMPELNGIQLCRMFRADPAFKGIPVIFLTAKAEEHDRVQGFETGADDYICKPFSIKELVLRVRALLRRASPGANQEASQTQLHAGRLVLDRERHVVTVADAPVSLTATEFRLLQLLMERRGRVQTREHLLVSVWNYETEIETRTIDTHVRRLREKLGGEAAWIETIRGIGYRFSENAPREAS
ncbi:two-component system phosphate regulon response regulator PhoB [Ereboglobus sp. PH5-10]|uniref:response regulator n=1 Tax=Ereboglobus sp. PH5-10 TaxID=2940629 RepID=UPI0024071D3A|nr:response regulator transcription factor [Ereboglobus sp. PH5-10]MDF9826842.1 two-component system phosphate regulon response regulator PhoB [Ereboglobus sp. PH5-10]